MLPNETILQVLHFADYRTLVLAKLAAAPFLRVTTKFAEKLACRHRFHIAFYAGWVTYKDVTLDTQRVVHYELSDLASLAAACREVSEGVGPHAVARAIFRNDTFIPPVADVIFEAAPPMTHADDVTIVNSGARAIAQNSDAFVSNFARIKSLRRWLDNDAFRQIGWRLLRLQYAPELRPAKLNMTIYLSSPNPTVEMESSVEELVRSYVTLPLLGGEAPDLTLDFSQNFFAGAFCLRIIEVST